MYRLIDKRLILCWREIYTLHNVLPFSGPQTVLFVLFNYCNFIKVLNFSYIHDRFLITQGWAQ